MRGMFNVTSLPATKKHKKLLINVKKTHDYTNSGDCDTTWMESCCNYL